MKLNVSEKIAVGTASYVTVVFLIVTGSSARGQGPGNVYGPDTPGEQALYEAKAREAAREGPAGPRERMIDTDRGKASGEKAHDMTHSDATGAAADVLNRISRETSVPVATLQTEKSATRLGFDDLEIANLLAKASGQRFDSIVAKFKAGEDWGKIAHDMGLNLGKIVSDAHRSNLENKGKHLGQETGENSGKRSLIPGPGVHEDSIIFTGITSIPSATDSRRVNPVPSATMSPRP